MSARIPVFVSAPSSLSAEQQASYSFILDVLGSEHFEPRALGRSDYGVDYPLKEVYSIARHCSGGLILGYSQMRAPRLEIKPGTTAASSARNVVFPSPWNNLEAGILFGLKLPLMVFREDGIQGGIFDNGVSDVFVQRLPLGSLSADVAEALGVAIKNWAGKVREHYRAY